MNLTVDVDEPEEILAYVAPPLLAVREAFFDGVSYADTQLAGQPFDSHYWSHSVRFRARVLLEAAAASTPPNEWQLGRNLGNSGIEIVRGPLVIRVLKSQESGPPHPGYSRARRDFWKQVPAPREPLQLTLALAFGGYAAVNGGNLLLDWNVGTRREIVLALSKPAGVWKYQTKPKIAWRRHVTFDSDNHPDFVPPEEDVYVEEVEFDSFDIGREEEGSQ